MKAKILFVSVLLIMVNGGSLLRAEKPPIRWGTLLPEDTAMKVYAPDPSASAVVLCAYGTTWVGPRVKYTEHIRIKILKEAGLVYANVEIPYRSYDHYDYFSDLRAETFNTGSGGKVVRTRLKSSQIKDVKIDDRHRKKVFTFPDAKVGSVIEYTYTLNSLDLVKLNNWYFQQSIPVIWSEYRINIPRKFNYLVTFQQGKPLSRAEQLAYAGKLQWLYSRPINSVYSELGGNHDVLYQSPGKELKVYLAQGESLRFVMDHMPALGTVSSSPDIYPYVKADLYLTDGPFPFFFRTSLVAANEDYAVWDRWQNRFDWWPRFVPYWMPTWDEATKDWLSNDYLGQRIHKGLDSKKILEGIAHADTMDLAKGIFNYVRQHVTWNGTYSMYGLQSFKAVLRHHSGNSGEMNLMMINLLRSAGFHVTPVLVKTNNLGRVENMFPEKGQFNHILARILLNGKMIYLDATSDTFTGLSPNVNHTTGWILQNPGYGWVTVTNHSGDEQVNYPQI